MTVEEMLSRMTSKEYAEWIAYDTLEPIGPWRDALLWVTLRNAWRGKEDRPVTLQDYPFLHEPKPEQTMDEMKAILRSIVGGST